VAWNYPASSLKFPSGDTATDVILVAMALRSAEALVEIMTTGKEPDWFPKSFRLERAWKQEETKWLSAANTGLASNGANA
jgi:hypothetical protein